MLCLVSGAAEALELERVHSLVREGRFAAASALLSAEMALEPDAGSSRDRLRIYLLKSILDGMRGRFDQAREWLDLATIHWKGAMGSDPGFGAEIELVRHDLQVLERRGSP